MSEEDSTWCYILYSCKLILMFVATISTLIGNSLVLLAWTLDRRFRSPQNAYIVSLSVVDFLMGVLILPVDIAIEIKSPWVTNPTICKLRFIVAIFLCTLSVTHLSAIAADRYRVITEGVRYIQERSGRNVGEIVIYLYIVAAWVSAPPVIDWADEYWPNLSKGVCTYSKSAAWILRFDLGLFYLPTTVIVVMYWKTFRDLKKRLRNRAAETTGPVLPSTTSETIEASGRKISDDSSGKQISNGRSLVVQYFQRGESTNPQEANVVLGNSKEEGVKVSGCLAAPSATVKEKPVKFSLKKEQQAAKTLEIIIGAYLICWVPYFACHTSGLFFYIPWIHTTTVYAFTAFMGHANSGVNPIIYAWRNEDFKRALSKMIFKSRKAIRRSVY